MDLNLIINGLAMSFIGTLLVGVLTALVPSPRLARSFQFLLALFTAVGAVASAAFLVRQAPAMSVSFSGVTFFFDRLSVSFLLIVNLIASLAVIYGAKYLALEKEKYSPRAVHFLTAVFIFGMQGVLLAANAVSFLVFWELMSVASFFLVLADRKEESLKAALFYLVITHLGAGALLAGFALITSGNLALDFPAVAGQIKFLAPATLTAASGLFCLAFASKAGLFPFHSWLPRAHPQAPSHISALMSGVMLKVAVYGLLRMLLDILPPLPWTWGGVLIVLGLLSAIFAVLRAAIDQDIKRILAFSSIENMGIIFIMLGLMIAGRALNSPLLAHAALVAALVHICAHALFKSGLFLGAGVLAHAAHSRDLDALGGLAKRMPLFSGAMLILSLAAAALPPFGAFVSEWFLLQSILTTLATAVVPLKILFVLVLAGIGLIGGVALFALVRFFGLAFLAEPRSPAAAQAKTPALSLSAPITILAVLTILFGVGVPIILPWLGAPDFSFGLSVKLGAGNLPLGLLATVLLGIFLGVVILRKIISNVRRERMYHTWDCGQPINATMEYTGMAFAAPFRFFFRWPLRRYKTVTSQAVLESNRWIRTYKLGFIQKRNYILRCYDWIGEAILFFSKLLSRFQSGIIQFYIALILITLIATILISL